MSEELLPPGTDIDLDNCAREPIHIPGSIQPRGVFAVVREPELTVVQISANVADVLGVPVATALEHPLAALVGAMAEATIRRAIASFSDLRERNPIEVDIVVDGRSEPFDAIAHRVADGVLFVELEAAYGPRPFSFPNTYLAVRGAVSELNRAADLSTLYDITARTVRDLTGFDRVMVYRYDHAYNGEVVAEAKRAGLNSFLGLHYPASDIPAQARALYEKNWIRLINDVDYVPSPIVPTVNPLTGGPIDLTHATLRSVSPIHVEYLRNMDVRASMSISLLRDGTLWGLIACHHYSGPHLPPYGTRAAAEFLGSALSLRLVARYEEDELRDQVRAQALLGRLNSAMLDPRQSVARAALNTPGFLDLVGADGAAARAQNEYLTVGTVPDRAAVDTVAAWAAGAGEALAATDSLGSTCPGLDLDARTTSGALVLTLPDDQYVAWFRAEEEQSVDWGGDPTNKALAVREGDSVRISPRKSFERWQETVRGRSRVWTDSEQQVARQLRGLVVDAMYQRARGELRLAEQLQRSLLPTLPHVEGWELSARYEPAEGGRIGGDWYDAFAVPGGRFAVVLGDVAGHGIQAAGVMAQLRNVLRAFLFDGLDPAAALTRTNQFVESLLGGSFATVLAACIDAATGEVTAVSAGHPVPFVVPGTGRARPLPLPLRISPPLGVRDATYREDTFTLARGETLVLFSDGLIERRGEDIELGRARLAGALELAPAADADALWESLAHEVRFDDSTILRVRRPS